LSWTRPVDLRAQVQRWWDRGELLAAQLNAQASFPRRLVLKVPGSKELAERFDEVRAWIAELSTAKYVRVEFRSLRHRLLGQNQVPAEAWVDSLADALALIGKRREAERFGALVATTRLRQPELLSWLEQKPLRALDLADDWQRLLDLVSWIQANPHCGRYLRQIDLPGVHTKFIETHRSTLAEFLDRVLPPDAINGTASGVTQFARRYGFRDKPLRVRFRVLDPERAVLPFGGDQDITLDAPSFARLHPNISRVLITENEVNFLALPPFPDSLAIFGAGYGFEVLGTAMWLYQCRLLYWGDIDTHGFAILDQLRAVFPHAESLLMDRSTLLSFRDQWGREDKPTKRELGRLTADEATLYDELRNDRYASNLRLEQERIGFNWIETTLRQWLES
jgi:hypothetical protein